MRDLTLSGPSRTFDEEPLWEAASSFLKDEPRDVREGGFEGSSSRLLGSPSPLRLEARRKRREGEGRGPRVRTYTSRDQSRCCGVVVAEGNSGRRCDDHRGCTGSRWFTSGETTTRASRRRATTRYARTTDGSGTSRGTSCTG